MREAKVRLETNRRAKMIYRLLSIAQLLQRAPRSLCASASPGFRRSASENCVTASLYRPCATSILPKLA